MQNYVLHTQRKESLCAEPCIAHPEEGKSVCRTMYCTHRGRKVCVQNYVLHYQRKESLCAELCIVHPEEKSLCAELCIAHPEERKHLKNH